MEGLFICLWSVYFLINSLPELLHSLEVPVYFQMKVGVDASSPAGDFKRPALHISARSFMFAVCWNSINTFYLLTEISLYSQCAEIF